MSLDQNLFTLLFAPSKDDPNVTDLVDPSENPHYRKERVIGETYRINVYGAIPNVLCAADYELRALAFNHRSVVPIPARFGDRTSRNQ